MIYLYATKALNPGIGNEIGNENDNFLNLKIFGNLAWVINFENGGFCQSLWILTFTNPSFSRNILNPFEEKNVFAMGENIQWSLIYTFEVIDAESG